MFDNKKFTSQKTLSNKKFVRFFSILFMLVSIYLFINKKLILSSSLILVIIIMLFSYWKKPQIITYLKNLWMGFGKILSLIVGNIFIIIIFLFIITPTGIYYKLFKKNKVTNTNFNNNVNQEIDFYKEF